MEKIVSYYIELNANTAKRYYSGIMEIVKPLSEFPKSGRIIPECQDDFSDKYREVIFKNYRIMYRINENDITILRIMDLRCLLDINFLE